MNFVLDIAVIVVAFALAVGALLVVYAGWLAIRREFFNPDGTMRRPEQ